MHPLTQRVNAGLRRLPVWPFYIAGFGPFAWWLTLALTGRLGADPVKALEHALGEFAFQLLIASLAITPLMRLARINAIRFRRMLGLMAFYYVLLHFAVYLFLDLQLEWEVLVKDLTKRPYIIAGTLALVLLIPLGITSNDLSIRRLGAAAWKRLHQLVFPAAVLAAVHYLWLVKTITAEPLIYAGLVALLLVYRLVRAQRERRREMAVSALG